MKKLWALLLAVCLCLGVAGCSGEEEQPEEEISQISQVMEVEEDDKPRFVPDGDAFYQFEKGLIELNRFSFDVLDMDASLTGAVRAVDYLIVDEPTGSGEEGEGPEMVWVSGRIALFEFEEDSEILAEARETGVLLENGEELEVDVHETMPLVVYCDDPEEYWLVLFIFDSIVPEA